MAPRITIRRADRLAKALSAYEREQAGDADFIIPEDLSALTDEELSSLHTEAVNHFDAVYNGGEGLSDADLAALASLTEGIEAIQAETSSRQTAAAERAQQANELATRVHHEERTEEITETEDDGGTGDEGETQTQEGEEGAEGEGGSGGTGETGVVAGGTGQRRAVRVNLAQLSRRRGSTGQRPGAARTMNSVAFAGSSIGEYTAGQGVNWHDIGRILDRRLSSFNPGQFTAAQRARKHLRQQFSLATFHRNVPEELTIQHSGREHVDEIMARAADERRLEGGSLVAAGGWCAPSEIMYDFLELESRDGLVSVPEFGVRRGGIQFTTGIDYSDIYAGTGFSYTEAHDIAGTYDVDANGDGTGEPGDKPCYVVECPEFEEARLGIAGLCIKSGLLQQRGYPEILARTTRGALIAHDHKMSARVINAMVTGSTPVVMPANTVGALSPTLTAIELQVEHYRYVHRLRRGTTLEAIFPYWIRGAIRSDLALRAGLDLIDVTDARINNWFASRGIAPQFVYDWQPITGAAGAFVQWPATVQFLLYVAGTWTKGVSDVITLDTIYDSVLLGQNDFTALFTEEGWLVAKRGTDSRVVTVAICADGSTGAPVYLACDGEPAVAGDGIPALDLFDRIADELAELDRIADELEEDDHTAPTVGTLAISSETKTTLTLTVTGAADAGGLDPEPYRFSTNGGVTWSEWQTSNVYLASGLTAETTYHCRHETRDAAGNVSVGAIVNGITTSGT